MKAKVEISGECDESIIIHHGLFQEDSGYCYVNNRYFNIPKYHYLEVVNNEIAVKMDLCFADGSEVMYP